VKKFYLFCPLGKRSRFSWTLDRVFYLFCLSPRKVQSVDRASS